MTGGLFMPSITSQHCKSLLFFSENSPSESSYCSSVVFLTLMMTQYLLSFEMGLHFQLLMNK